MAKTLVLAEKPSVGKELARVLGAGKGGDGYMEGAQYIVRATPPATPSPPPAIPPTASSAPGSPPSC